MKTPRRFGLPAVALLHANREPLYRRLPTRDEHGNHLIDFMMLLPGLGDLPRAAFEVSLANLHALLAQRDEVVFADLNTRSNLLWVSLRRRQGAIIELADEIRGLLPRARLVGHPPAAAQPGRRKLARVRRLLKV